MNAEFGIGVGVLARIMSYEAVDAGGYLSLRLESGLLFPQVDDVSIHATNQDVDLNEINGQVNNTSQFHVLQPCASKIIHSGGYVWIQCLGGQVTAGRESD